MIKVDLHVHAKVSKLFPFEIESFQKTVRQAMKVGLRGFAITEHFHSSDYWQAMDLIMTKYCYRAGQVHPAPGFNVLTGAELTVADGADIILIGQAESLLRLDEHFSPRLSAGCFPRLRDVFEPARNAGLIMIGAHPTRPGKRLVAVGEQLLGLLDALEINGKDVAQRSPQKEVAGWADKAGLPLVGSSDAHLWPQVGVQRTLAPLPELTLEGLRLAISQGMVQTETLPSVRQVVKLCGTHKRLAKVSRHAQQLTSGKPRLLPQPMPGSVLAGARA